MNGISLPRQEDFSAAFLCRFHHVAAPQPLLPGRAVRPADFDFDSAFAAFPAECAASGDCIRMWLERGFDPLVHQRMDDLGPAVLGAIAEVCPQLSNFLAPLWSTD